MKPTTAYTQTQNLTLDSDTAFEELYARLARWSGQAVKDLAAGDQKSFEAMLEKSLSLLGFMDRCIDVNANYELASRILSLHRFVIGTLVRAKAERNASALEGMPQVFVALADIFVAIRKTNEPARKSGNGQV